MYSLHAVSKVFLSMFKGKSDVKACFSKIFILPCCDAINLTRPKRKVALTSGNNAERLYKSVATWNCPSNVSLFSVKTRQED